MRLCVKGTGLYLGVRDDIEILYGGLNEDKNE